MNPTTTTTIVEAAAAGSSSGLGDSVWVLLVLPLLLAVGGGLWKWATAVGERRAQQQQSRRDAASETFTNALDAVHEYQELPYRIRRRSDVPPMTREELTWHASNVQVLLDKHVTRLTFISPEVGEAYRALVCEARKESGKHMSTSWTQPRIVEDKDMNLGNAYPRTQAEGARENCIAAMQQFLDAPAASRRNRRGGG